MENCVASLHDRFGCDLRFRVVYGMLLHATTVEARSELVKVLGPVDFTVWLVVLANPELDFMVVAPASDLVDIGEGTREELAEFKAPRGDTSPGLAWLESLFSEEPDHCSTLDNTFGPTILRTATDTVKELKRREAEEKKAAAAEAAAAKKEQKAVEKAAKAEQAALDSAAAREKKEEKKEEEKESKKLTADKKREQVALPLTLTLTLTLLPTLTLSNPKITQTLNLT
jgi:hypothetical protein